MRCGIVKIAVLVIMNLLVAGCAATNVHTGEITPEEQRQMHKEAEQRTWLQLLVSLIPSAIILSR